MRVAAAAILVAFVSGAALAQEGSLGTDSQRAEGKTIYDKMCAQCHGETGDGQGPARDFFSPSPRDFRRGLFKIRTTASGELPTHDDLKRVIREGMPYTGMPAWPHLSDGELDNVVYYVKSLSAGFEDPNAAAEPLEIKKGPGFSRESAERGAKIYEENKCADCHGRFGRTDGKSALTLTNEWEEPIRPADLTKRWTFRGGVSREDIYRTFTTGLNGTPMPSYADLIEEEDRWHLVDFVYSLSRDDPGYAVVVRAVAIEGEIDPASGVSLFSNAPVATLPLFGQVVEPERNYFPATTSIDVRAIYDADEIAILVTWNDMVADTAGSNSPLAEGPGATPTDTATAPPETTAAPRSTPAPPPGAPSRARPSDAVAVQVPSAMPEGVARPYFLFGDARNSVDLWFVDLARGEGELFVGRGSLNLDRTGAVMPAHASFQDGEWGVLFMQERQAPGKPMYAEGGFVPIAFSIWDGWSGDRGNRRSVTSWYHLYLEPARAESKLAPIAASGALVLLLEMGVIGAVRRKKGVPIPGFAAWSSGMSRARSLNVDLGFSLLGGLVGTIAMTIFLYLVLPTLDQRPLDIAALVGEVFDVGWAMGVLTHIVLGALVFPLLFVVFIYPALPGPAWFKGLLWGCFLWIVAEIVAVPIAHGGVFHATAGGVRAAFGFLAGHILYGVVLGAVAGSSGPDD